MESRKIRRLHAERIRMEASDWVSKHDRGLTAQEQDVFFDWLARDPKHAEAYNESLSVWNEMNVLADWRPEHSLEPNADLLAHVGQRSNSLWARVSFGIAALLVLGLFVSSLLLRKDRNEVMMLASGQAAMYYEHHVLEDGSIVELNRGAQVSIRFSDEKRLIDLHSGEAHFTVAKDPDRPFIVRARGTVLQAVGTAFNVALNAREVEVLVTEGSILLNPSIATTNGSVIDKSEPLVRELNAGQGSVVFIQAEDIPIVIEDFSDELIEQRLAWKSEMLDFTETPLSEVILDFNRSNHTQLVLGDIALGNLRFSAALRPDNLDGFLELLALTENIQVERVGVAKIVLYEGD